MLLQLPDAVVLMGILVGRGIDESVARGPLQCGAAKNQTKRRRAFVSIPEA